MRPLRNLNLTCEEQGYRWRQAGGRLEKCWYREGSVEHRLFSKGWKQADAELARLASEHNPDL